MDEGLISMKALIQLFEQMPVAVDVDNNKGISKDSFIALNTMMDVMIDKSAGPNDPTVIYVHICDII